MLCVVNRGCWVIEKLGVLCHREIRGVGVKKRMETSGIKVINRYRHFVFCNSHFFTVYVIVYTIVCCSRQYMIALHSATHQYNYYV